MFCVCTRTKPYVLVKHRVRYVQRKGMLLAPPSFAVSIPVALAFRDHCLLARLLKGADLNSDDRCHTVNAHLDPGLDN